MKPWDETRDSRPDSAEHQAADEPGHGAHLPVHCLYCGMPQFPERSIGLSSIRVAFECSTCGWAVTAEAMAPVQLLPL